MGIIIGIGGAAGGGGGGGVTAPSLPSGLTLSSSATTLSFSVTNNDADNPCAIDLAFSSSALQAAAWDQGTATSPSFVIEGGATRALTLERGSGAPEFGDPNVTETVTALLADGSTVSTTVSVAGIQFHTAVSSLNTPLFEFLMDAVDGSGNMVNTGSVGSSRNAVLGNTAVSSTSDQFQGAVNFDSSSDYITSIGGSEPLSSDFCRNQSRSYIFVWDTVTDLSTSAYIAIANGSASNNGWGWLHTTATLVKSQYLWSSSATNLSAANGTHSGSGSAQDLVTTKMPDGSPRRCFVTVSYDHSAVTATVRWKKQGDPAGHTYRTSGTSTGTSSGAQNVRWAGWTSGGSANEVNWRYIAVVNGTVSAAFFDQLAAIAGI